MILESTNPAYGLPIYPPNVRGVGEIGHAHRVHKPYKPPYITGLGLVYEGRYQDYSGPYIEDSSSKDDRDRALRRRRAEKGTHCWAQERFKVHEAEIQRLKQDLEKEQQRQ